jgi:nitroreductase
MEGFDLDTLEARLDGHGGFDKASHRVACLVAFGYRAKEAQARHRRPRGETVVGWA